MPVPARRPAAAAAAPKGVDFGSMNSPVYSGSFTLPEGDWAVWFDIIIQQPKADAKFKQERLGVRLTCVNLNKPGAEPVEQFLSMGSKAMESFLPSEDGKSLVPVVGGPGNMTNKSNWNLFRDSLYNSGLPVGIFSDSLAVLDGIWVHTAQEPEPEERKGYAQSSTGEAAQEGGGQKQLGKIPVVTAILDGGEPWNGGGGMPDAAPAAPTPKASPARAAAPAPAAKAAPARPGPARAAAPAPVAEDVAEGDASDPDAVMTAAVNAITDVLTQDKYKASCPKLILKTSVFKIVGERDGKDMAQAVTNTYFNDDESLVGILDQLDYTLSGTAVKPKA